MATSRTQRLRAHKLEIVLLALLAGLAAVAVWAVVQGFGASVSPAGLPTVVLATGQDSVGDTQVGGNAETATSTQSSATTTSTGATNGTTVSTAAQPSQVQAGAGRTVVTQRLRTSSPGNGQDTGAGGPRSGQPGQGR